MWLRQRGAPSSTKILPAATVSDFLGAWREHTSPINGKDKECVELWLHSTLYPPLPYCSTGGFGLYFKITGGCSMLLCLCLEQPVSGLEEGGSQVMWNTENVFISCFVCSQLGAGQGNTSPWLRANVISPGGIRYPTKVSFKNTFPFGCFYIHCTCPPQESKVQVLPC